MPAVPPAPAAPRVKTKEVLDQFVEAVNAYKAGGAKEAGEGEEAA